jgi:hypothetical protein
MPKSKAAGVMINQVPLVDAEAMGGVVGHTAQYVNRLANEGKIPWHGVRNGVKVYRRFDVTAVLAALSHGVEAPDKGDAQIASREIAAPPNVSHKRRAGSSGIPAAYLTAQKQY